MFKIETDNTNLEKMIHNLGWRDLGKIKDQTDIWYEWPPYKSDGSLSFGELILLNNSQSQH